MKLVIPEFMSPYVVLSNAGYQNHWTGNGMMRMDGSKGNKFHAIIKDKEIDIHYDKEQGGYHSAAPKVFKLKFEIKRIKKVNWIKR